MLTDAAPRVRGRPRRTEAQKRVRRATLVEAAIDAIRQLGPELSIDDIAAVAGVSKPVLYAEFGGRVGIADAIAVVVTEQLERQVMDSLAAGGSFDIGEVVRVYIESLVDLIDREPALYVFLVRSMRSADRGFLDNALVAGIHERAAVMVGFIAPGLSPAQLRILTDGLFGFVFAAVESWQATKQPDRGQLVGTLTHVIRTGFSGVADQLVR